MNAGPKNRARAAAPVFRKIPKDGDLNPTIIKQARKSGQLNLSNKGLVSVPEQVWTINIVCAEDTKSLSLSFDTADSDRWWDQVDLTKLLLSSNKLDEISPKISHLSALQVLDLYDNILADLPSEIGELKCLRHLNLSRNKIESLPDNFFNLNELQVLNLSYNCLSSIHENISNLNVLQKLDLSHNVISSLPPSIGFLSRLTIFELASNKLKEIPPEIGCMQALRHLDLSHNEIHKLPSEMGELLHLAQLYMKDNRLKELPRLENCAELKELHLGENAIQEINIEQLEPLVNLTVLDLRENNLTSVPDGINILQRLERLDLTNNNLSGLPATLGLLGNLKSLQLDGNLLRTIRRDILQRGTVQVLKFLRSRLDKCDSPEMNNGYNHQNSAGSNKREVVENGKPHSATKENEEGSKVEIDVFTLRKSRTLDLSNRQAEAFADSVFETGASCEVTCANLNRNRLKDIPEKIVLLLPYLNEFQVSHNMLVSIPSLFEGSQRLTFLDFSNNRINELTFNFSSLPNLREVWLSGNKISKIPESIYNSAKLEILMISDNQISFIDVPGLLKLSRLATLDLRNNNITHVPPELGNVTQLRSLQLEGNPFRQPRPQILVKGTQALLEYLRDRIVS